MKTLIIVACTVAATWFCMSDSTSNLRASFGKQSKHALTEGAQRLASAAK